MVAVVFRAMEVARIFSWFKMFLRTRMLQLMLTCANEDLTSEQVVDALLHAIQDVLQQISWAPTFARNSLGPEFEVFGSKDKEVSPCPTFMKNACIQGHNGGHSFLP